MEKEKKTIHSLQRILKLENSKVSNLKNRIAKVLSDLQECNQKIETINQKIEQEKGVAQQDIELKKIFGAFLGRLNLEKQQINNQIQILNEQLQSLTEELKEAYMLVKGYEKVIANKKEAIQKKMDLIEQKNLDEIAIRKFNTSLLNKSEY